MGCLKITYNEEEPLAKNWKIFVGGVEKKVVTKKNRLNYSTFGSTMPGRDFSSSSYRYGFGGQEKDDEIKGAGNSINYKYRMHDPRLGRFFSVDPLSPEYPMLTPYQFASNSPVWMLEREGLEGVPSNKTAFVYYVGGDNFDGFGFGGHTGAGVYNPSDPNNSTFYGPFSGHAGETQLRKYDHGDVEGFSEAQTLKHYLDSDELVQRIHYDNLSDDAFDAIEGAIDNNVRNNKDGDGVWCSCQVENMFRDAFIEAGDTKELAIEKAQKMVPYTLPEELNQSEILGTGATKYDRFYKKEDKYYHDESSYDSKNETWNTTTTEITDFDEYFSTEPAD